MSSRDGAGAGIDLTVRDLRIDRGGATILDDVSFSVSFSAALTCLSNVGPGLQEIGPVGSFAEFSPLSKVVLSVTMIAGRLELFPILVLFSRRTWSRS